MSNLGKVGSVFVEVITAGLAKVQQDLNKVAALAKAATRRILLPITIIGRPAIAALSAAVTQLRAGLVKLVPAIQSIGSVATTAFAAGTAAITGFVSAADPGGMLRFQSVLARISVQIGSIFIPLLRDVTTWLERVLDWFRALSEQQKDAILGWTKYGLAAAGLLAILPRLVGALSFVGTVVGGLGAAFATAALPLLGLVAVAGVAAVALGRLFGGLDGKDVGGAFGQVGAALSQLGSRALDVFAAGLDGLLPLATATFDRLSEIAGNGLNLVTAAFGAYLPHAKAIVEQVASTFMEVLPKIGSAFNTILDTAGDVLGSLAVVAGPVMNALGSLHELIYTAVIPVIGAFVSVLATAVDALGPVVSQIFSALEQPVVWLFDLLTTLLDIVQPVIDGLSELGTTLVELFGPAIQGASVILSGFVAVVQNLMTLFGWALQPIIDLLVRVLKPAFEVFGTVIKFMSDGIRTIVNDLIRFVNYFIGYINSWFPGALKKIDELVDTAVAKSKQRMAAPVQGPQGPPPHMIPDRPGLPVVPTLPDKGVENEYEFLEKIAKAEPTVRPGNLDPADNMLFTELAKEREIRREIAKNRMKDILEARIAARNIPDREAVQKASETETQKQRDELAKRMPTFAPKPQLVSIIDAWKRAQSATQALTPEKAAEEERIRLAQGQLDAAQQLNETNKKQLEEEKKTNDTLNKLIEQLKKPGKLGP